MSEILLLSFSSLPVVSSSHIQLEAHAHLVPTGIEVLGIDQSGQSEFHTCREKYTDYINNTQLLIESRMNLERGFGYLASSSVCNQLQPDWRCLLWPTETQKKSQMCVCVRVSLLGCVCVLGCVFVLGFVCVRL